MPQTPSSPAPGSHSQVAIVVNPTKFGDLPRVQRELQRIADQHDAGQLRWYETDADDAGLRATQRALDEGATLVCSFGGDGTVRAVATVLAGGAVPMGLLPGGTGNLLARNLALPLRDPSAALAVALTGSEKLIDTAVATFGDCDGATHEERFLVMGGMGLDADTMATTKDRLKRRIGWLAYVVAGAKDLWRIGFRASLDSPDHLPTIQHARSVLFGNCGTLTAGIQLMPEADPADGLLDAAIISPYGLMGWLAVLGNVVTGGRTGHWMVSRRRGTEFTALLNQRVRAEIDGDYLGYFDRVHVRCDPGSLLVRVPVAGSTAAPASQT